MMAMMAMLLRLKSSVYGLAEAYFELGYGAGFDWPLRCLCHTDLATLSASTNNNIAVLLGLVVVPIQLTFTFFLHQKHGSV